MCHKSGTSWQAVLESLQIAGARKKPELLHTLPKSSMSNQKREPYKAAQWSTNSYNWSILAQVSLSPRRSRMIYINSETVIASVSQYSNKKRKKSTSIMEKTVLINSATNTKLLESTSFFVTVPESASNAIQVNSTRQENLTMQDWESTSNCTSTSRCNNTLLYSQSTVNKVTQLSTA